MARREARSKATEKKKSAPRPHHTILGLSVQGGFIDGVKLELADGLNCVIGGRGTGKTTVHEFVRYVLGLMPDTKTGGGRASETDRLVKGNLGTGRVRLRVRSKDGVEYSTERSWGEPPQVLDAQGKPKAISLDRDLTFRADLYSQHEIEEIATTPHLQLALVDRFVDEDARVIERDVRQVLGELKESAAELARIDAELAGLKEIARDAESLEEKLKGLEATTGRDSAKVNAAHLHKALRERERKALELLKADAKEVAQTLEAEVQTLVTQIASRVDDELVAGPNQPILGGVREAASRVTKELKDSVARVKSAVSELDARITTEATVLAEAHAKQDQEYRALVERTKEEQTKIDERTKAHAQHLEAIQAKKDADARSAERELKARRRRELLARLSSLRDKRYFLRKGVADSLTEDLDGVVRVSVEQAAGKAQYRSLLTDSLKNAPVKAAPIVDKVAQTTAPEEFANLVREGDAAALADRLGVDQERATRVIDAIKRDPQRVYEIETVELEDAPKIELNDNGTYKESADLSTGQKCTSILPILLRQSDRPLLIDQPEDNLDNEYIFETIVPTLLDMKGRRQLVFVTHNPNIPVLGDAERVFVLESDGKHGRVRAFGTVDEVREDVENLLEGGAEAFLERKRRYKH